MNLLFREISSECLNEQIQVRVFLNEFLVYSVEQHFEADRQLKIAKLVFVRMQVNSWCKGEFFDSHIGKNEKTEDYVARADYLYNQMKDLKIEGIYEATLVSKVVNGFKKE